MDIQLKRGMLDVCVLAAIKDEDSYGYQIIKDMKPYYHITDAGRARIEEFKEEWKELESIYRFIVKEEVRDEQTGIS